MCLFVYTLLFAAAPRDVIITLEKYPIADVTWKDPLVGSGPVDMYKVAVVVPQGHAPLLVDKHTNNIKLEAHTSSRGAFLLSITIAAIYGFKLEGITLNRSESEDSSAISNLINC